MTANFHAPTTQQYDLPQKNCNRLQYFKLPNRDHSAIAGQTSGLLDNNNANKFIIINELKNIFTHK